MLNQETRNILKQVTKIGNSAILRYPVSTITNIDKSVIAFVDMSKLESEFEELGLAYFSDFLALIDFYTNPEVSYDNGTVTIEADDGIQHYQTSEVNRLKSVDVPAELLEKMESVEPVCNLEISSSDIERAKKIGSLSKSDSFVIEVDDNKSNIVVCKIDDNGNITNDSSTEVSSNYNEPTKIEMKISNIDKLPSYDYNVAVIKNPKTQNYVTIWEAVDAPIKIVITVQQSLI